MSAPIKCVACEGEGNRQIFDGLWMYGMRNGVDTCPDCDGTGVFSGTAWQEHYTAGGCDGRPE